MFRKCVISTTRKLFCSYATRRPDLSSLTTSDVEFFRSVLGSNRLLSAPADLSTYNTDWIGQYKGNSQLVLFPSTTIEVSQILKYCNTRYLAIVPQGGNTGLVGGSVPVFDEIILNTRFLNRILNFDKTSGVLTCEAGCILETLDDFVATEGHCVPLDLTPKGSCHIGGNIATNAGGTRVIRYGSLHGNVLGLEVVLPSGEVLEMDRGLRKDNTGYDMKQLFIGSEGTLGVVTKCSLLCPVRSSAQNTCLMVVKDFPKALKVLKKAQLHLGEIFSALEFIDSESYQLVFEIFPDYKKPFPLEPNKMYLLLETLGSHDHHDKEKINTFLEDALGEGLVEDGVLAQGLTQVKSMWKIRESITEAIKQKGYTHKYDLSLPHEQIYKLVEATRERVGNLACTVVGFGHLGDGNLHLNVATHEPTEKILPLLEPFVFDWTAERQGSISAEHGLGLMKANRIHLAKSSVCIEYMRKMKNLLDPQGILNPYKVLC